MKTCPKCKLIQHDSTTICDCGMPLRVAIRDEDAARIYAEERLRFEARSEIEGEHRTKPGSVFAWVAVVILGSGLLLFVGNLVSEAGKSPEQLARDRARDCVKTWQEHYAGQGYKRDMIEIAAVMKCTQELKALDQYDPAKR